MPNFCNGHYFLTVLAPVRTGSVTRAGDSFSHRQRLLETLARLPNSEVTVASRGTGGAGHGSPFARNTLTHLARFVLVDAPAFNGRVSGDTILAKLLKTDPHAVQEADRLSSPYLLFAADFDAADGSDASLERCTDALWETMQAELQQVFGFCTGFDDITTAKAFYAYIKRCQIETTMPFNDYWPAGTAIPADLQLPVDRIITAAKLFGAVVAGWLICVVLAALLGESGARDGLATLARWGLLVVPLLLAAGALYVYVLYRTIMRRGVQPLPRGAALPEVLKALYLQQNFIEFAIAQQGLPDAELQRAFGEFAARHRPSDLAAPTQPRGVIRLAKEISA